MSENQEAERETVWLVMMNGISSGFVYTSRQAARDQCRECQEAVAFVPQAAFAAERERAGELQRQLAIANRDLKAAKGEAAGLRGNNRAMRYELEQAGVPCYFGEGGMLANQGFPRDGFDCVKTLVDERDQLKDQLAEAQRLIGDAPNIKTTLPPEFQRLWEACNTLVEKAQFKAVFRHLEEVEKQLAEATARAEQAEADCAVKTKALSYVKMYGGHGEIEFGEDAGKSVSFFVEKSLDVNPGAAILAELRKLRSALKTIASYDSGNGCCEYGCDTPTIAREALEKGGES